MVEVTQDDIGWATSAAQHLCHPIDSPAAIRLLADAFARHRIAAEQRGKLEGARLALEAAAREADEHARLAWGIGEREGQSSICSSGRNYGARAVGQAIRALDPAKIVGEG